MKDFAGRTAIVTGAASGIGLGIAEALLREGMNVALADIRADKVEAACRGLRAAPGRTLALAVDVSDPDSVEAAARRVEEALGPLHVAVNNAGVAMHGTPLENISLDDWQWVIGVNIQGVINGIRSFVPRIRSHGQGGHVVNTASIGGFQVRPGWHTGAYSMTKYAVVALSEALEQELEGSGIGVSVLCPAAVRTSLYDSEKARPQRLGGPFERPQQHFLKDLVADGLAPIEVGERVVGAIRDGEFFVFTHSAPRQWIEERHRRLQLAFEHAAAFETKLAARKAKASP